MILLRVFKFFLSEVFFFCRMRFLFPVCKHTESLWWKATQVNFYFFYLLILCNSFCCLLVSAPHVEGELMWSSAVSSHWRSKANLGRNRQCVLCAWPTDGLRCTQACLYVVSHKIRDVLAKLHTCRYTHTCTRTHRGTQHLTSHEAHGKSHALCLIHANQCFSSQTHSHTYSWSLTLFTK